MCPHALTTLAIVAKHKKHRKPKTRSGRSSGRGPTPPRGGADDLLSLVRKALRDGPAALLDFASYLLAGTQRPTDPFARNATPPGPTTADMVESFVGVERMETSALLSVWRVLVTDELLRARINRELARRSTTLPEWMLALPDVRVRACTESTHVLGDGDNINLGIQLATGEELTAVLYIDHNLGTAVKDAFVVPESIERTDALFAEHADDPDLVVRPLDLADAKQRLLDALETGRHFYPPLESETWPGCEPLMRWWIALLPDGGQKIQHREWDQSELDAERDRFLASPHSVELQADPDHAELAETLFWFGSSYSGTDPLRWSVVRVEVLLLDWLPRKVVADADYLAKAPRVLRALVRYSHAERGIRSDLTNEVLASIDEEEPEYQRTIRSARPQGPAALLDRMGLLDDEDDQNDDELEGLSFEDHLRHFAEHRLADLAEQVGGTDVLNALPLDPLPTEPFPWGGIAEAARPRTQEVLDVLAAGLADDPELLTACQRLLARAVSGDPECMLRVTKAAPTAAAVAWSVGHGNRFFDGATTTVKEFLSRFGATGSPSQRAEVLLSAAGLTRDNHNQVHLPLDLITSSRRRTIVDEKARHEQLRDRLAGSAGESGLNVVRLQVVLRNVTPEVRRVVDVPGDIGLPLLHLVLQEAVGWERAHLHQFVSGSRRWSRPDLDGALDETAATLRDLGPRFVYEYDFGDGWEHEVVLVGPGVAPGLVEGSGACPPEDCGGPWGFEELQQVLADPRHPEHADRLEWLGGPLLDYDHDRHTTRVAQLLA